MTNAQFKKAEWHTPNKMKVDTPHQVFSRQTNLIAVGNVFANTQHSSYIRPFNETLNSAQEFRKKGHLQNWDLNHFSHLPYFVQNAVKTHAIDESVILYQFHHYRHNERVIHGYVITNSEFELLQYFVTGPTYKSEAVIEACLPYVSKKKLKTKKQTS